MRPQRKAPRGERVRRREVLPEEYSAFFSQLHDCPRAGWHNLGGGCYRRAEYETDQ